MDMGTEHPSIKAAGKGSYAGNVVFSMAGPWEVRLSVTVPGSQTPVVKTLRFEVVK
jgi:hypothetical protein